MRSEIKLITPAVAEEMLRLNVANRPLKAHVLRRYVDDMRSGRWMETGDAIRIANTGRLIDGQHRLRAIIESGISVRMIVVSDLAEDAWCCIDRGARRTGGDALAASGYKSATLLAAACSWVDRYERGDLLQVGRKADLSPAAALDTLARHPGLEDCLHMMKHSDGSEVLRGLIAGSLVVALRYLMGLKDDRQAEQFWLDVQIGAGLSADDPVLVFTRRLVANSTLPRHKRTPNGNLAIMAIRAWNSRRLGKKMSCLKGAVQEAHWCAII